MLKITLAGRVGKDAEARSTQGGTDICSFSVACDVGWGENKRTLWVDVAKFGAGAKGIAQHIRKGDPITVVGDLSTREHDGKTYLNCRADDIALQSGGGQRGERKQPYDSGSHTESYGNQQSSKYDDLDDDFPPF